MNLHKSVIEMEVKENKEKESYSFTSLSDSRRSVHESPKKSSMSKEIKEKK